MPLAVYCWIRIGRCIRERDGGFEKRRGGCIWLVYCEGGEGMGKKENPDTKQGFRQELGTILARRNNKKRLLYMVIGAAVMFFIFPLVLKLFPMEIQANVEFMRLLVLNQIFIGVVGWHANYYEKYGIYIPMLFIIVFLLSELMFYGQVSWSMETNYIQTGYILYFLRKFVARRIAQDEKKKNKPFPKSVTGRK